EEASTSQDDEPASAGGKANHRLRDLARWLWQRPVPALLLVGVLTLVVGLALASWAAVTHVSGRPGITASLKWDRNLGVLLQGSVDVSNIPSFQHLEMRVWSITGHGKSWAASPIYEASFG